MNAAGNLADRSAVYSVLQAVYTFPPTAEKMDALAATKVDDPLLAGPLESLRAAAQLISGSPERLEAVAQEFTRLFEGPGVPAAPPYASYYLNGGILMGPPAIAARRSYVEWGLVPEELGGVHDDHVALELAFLAHVTEEATSAWELSDLARVEACAANEKAFVRTHLVGWIPQFCDRMKGASSDPLFQELATVTRAVLERAA